MKKCFLVILLSNPLLIFSQNKKLGMDHENFFRAGIKGGVNINKVSGQSFKQGFNYNYQAGIFMQFNLASRFGIQPEVSFVQTSSEFSDDATDVYDDLFRDGSQKSARLNYLEVPVFLNVNIGTSKRVKLQIGPSYGRLLKATVDSLKRSRNIFADAEYSAIGGLWIQLPFVHIGARYKRGLTNVNAIDDKQTWKNQAIQIFAGVTF